MNKFIILIFGLFVLSGCTNDEHCGYNEKQYGDGMAFSWQFIGILESYSKVYNTTPRSADDILIFMERGEFDPILTKHDPVYRYLRKNRKKLLFAPTDSLIECYYKRIDSLHLVIRMLPCAPCSNIRSTEIETFDCKGYVMKQDSLLALKIKCRLRSAWSDYYLHHRNRTDSVKFDRIIMEYTPNHLMNLCKNEPLDTINSTYFGNMYKFLDSLAAANKFSRITVPCFIERNVNE